MKTLFLFLASTALSAQTMGNATIWGANVQQSNSGIVSGGYMRFEPVSYNPYNGATCMDVWGNKVQQPLPTPGAPPFGLNDLVLWNSLSPSMPFNSGTGQGLVQPMIITAVPSTGPGPCGPPLPVNQLYGLNTNGYFFGRAGLGTDSSYYNAIQALQGGVTANSITMGVLYPTGTVTTTGTLSAPAYLGGHVDIGHSVGPPATGTISSVTNPFSLGEGNVQGQMYYDDGLDCYNGFYRPGSSKAGWHCIDAGTGGTGTGIPGGVVTSLQVNAGGTPAAFGGYASLVYCTACGLDGASNIMTLAGGSANSGIKAPVFNSSAANSSTAPAIQTTTGTFEIFGDGSSQFQSVKASTAFNSLADVNGGSAFVTSTGTMHIDGTGAAFFQSTTAHVFNSNADATITGMVNTSGTAVTLVGTGGSPFYAGMVGGNMTINGVLYQVASFTDTTHVAVNVSAGTQSSVAYQFGNAIQTSLGGYEVTGSGITLGQQFVAHTTFNSQADVYGGNSFQNSTGNFYITGIGGGFFQTLTAGTTGLPDSTQVITVNPGYIYAHGGFATDSASTAAINANNGTIQGNILTAITALELAATSTTPSPQPNQAKIYLTTGGLLMATVNNGTAVNLLSGGSGGGPFGSPGQVSFNNAGTETGDANLLYTVSGGILESRLFHSFKGSGDNTDAFTTNAQEAHITGAGNVYGQIGTFNAVLSQSATAGFQTFDRNLSGASAIFYRNAGINRLYDSVTSSDFIQYGNIGGNEIIQTMYELYSPLTGSTPAFDVNNGAAVIYGNGTVTGQGSSWNGQVNAVGTSGGFFPNDRTGSGAGAFYRTGGINRFWDNTYGDMIQYGNFSGTPAVNIPGLMTSQEISSGVSGHNYAFVSDGGGAALWGDGYVTGQTGQFNEVQGITNNNSGQLRAALSNYGTIFRQDDANFYILITPSGSPFGSWSALRPFYINDASGLVTMANGVSISGGLTADNMSANTVTAGGSPVATQAYVNTQLSAYSVTAQFATVATTGVINGAAFTTGNGSFSVNSGGAIAGNSLAVSGNIQSTAIINGNSFTTNTGSWFVTSGGNMGANDLNIGGHNGGNIATSGAGAQINDSAGNVAMFTYDTGGVCGIGTGEPTPGVSCASDEKLKKNIKPLSIALNRVLTLQPKTYDWIGNGVHSVGFVAQDVQKTFPELVTEKDGVLMLSQEGMIPYLVKAVQEQQVTIQAQQKQIDGLLARVK